ncbi:MAG: Z1 domain-containing protein [Planctomycetaceae bacterium]|jgi:hypothetical protein
MADQSAERQAAFKTAVITASALLSALPDRTPQQIREFAELAIKLATGVNPAAKLLNVDELYDELRHLFSVTMEDGLVLDDATIRGHEPWLHTQRTSIEWRFWNRYQQYLQREKGLPPSVVESTDRITDMVLERLEWPRRPGPWDRRGMVVGSVQSGKTSNYTGLICKALDAGYKVVIILAGIHNDLRSQTQLRIDEGVLGFDSQKRNLDGSTNSRIGVGKMDARILPIHALTNSAKSGDLLRSVSQNIGLSPGSDPLIFVVKKNTSVLKNLAKCLQHAASVSSGGQKIVREAPLLLIDDEADNASINTARVSKSNERKRDMTAINRQIRTLLAIFEKSAYVGYTATPFANIFINPSPDDEGGMEDLFPRSFIINLPPPSNYIGPKRVFGLDGDPDAGIEASDPLPIVQEVTDYDQPQCFPPKHKMGHEPTELPESLQRAILCFVLTCAARRARGQTNQHNSMLIHVTRFVMVQQKVVRLVDEFVYALRNRLEYGDGARSQAMLHDLRDLWGREFVPVSQSLGDEGAVTPWSDVAAQLREAVGRIAVRGINGESLDGLDYRENQSEGMTVIAIGGDKLSRGLTLEGLSISYFLRTSQMYDTLMQMGRWFGYRPGYLDLCRLFTSPQLVEWYRHIALAEEELRREFEYMHARHSTPEEYGLRVRTHPGGMTVSALNKLFHTRKQQLSWEGQLVQTWSLPKQPDMAAHNVALTTTLCSTLGAYQKGAPGGGYLWRPVDSAIIADYLEKLRFPLESARASGRYVADYIRKQNSRGHGELREWTVALVSKSTATPEMLGGLAMGYLERSVTDENNSWGVTKANLLSPADEGRDFVDRVFDPEWFAQIADKPELADDLAFLEDQANRHCKAPDVALELTRRWQQSTPPKIRGAKDGATTATRANGRIIRLLRPRSQGLLLIYPMVLTQNNKPLETVKPIIGVAVSLPASHTATGVEYVVGKIWDAQQLAELNDEE